MSLQPLNLAVSTSLNRRAGLPSADEPRTAPSQSSREVSSGGASSVLRDLDNSARARQDIINAFAANDASIAGDDTSVQTLFEQQFAELAADSAAFHALMSDVYGQNYDKVAAESLRQRALDGDFSWLPTVRYVDESVLGNANGAYDSATNTIYINDKLQGTALAGEVFVEEAGHAIDTVLNQKDTVGDEGELFRRLLGGEEMNAADIQTIRAENDTGQITVDGETREVEFWSIGGWIQDKVIDPIKDNVIDPVVDFVDDKIVQPTIGLVDDVIDIGVNTFETWVDIGIGLATGDYRKVIDESVGYLIETAAMGAHTVSSYINGTLGLSETRGLTGDEEAYLRSIYGDSLDYDKIRIQQGGIEAMIGMDPHTVGNDIYLPDSSFGADGKLTQSGLELLSHEVAHSWQFQNGGAGYLSEAILSYVGDGDPYDWMAALDQQLAFGDMTPDQQAEFARLIGIAIALSPTGTLDLTSIEAVIGRPLSAAEFTYIQDIQARLLAGDA
jgi:hypothetical protein